MIIKIKTSDIIRVTVLTLMSVIVILPLMITFFAAFKTQLQLGSEFPLKIPNLLYLENFKTVFRIGHIGRSFFNSIFLVVFSLLINTLLASTVAYCLARFDFRLKKLIFLFFLLGMIVPIYVTEIARFGIIKMLGLYNTRWAGVMIYAGADMMQVYIYLQFIKQIPISLDESAMMEGLNFRQIYFKIIFPLIIPAVATLGILKIVDIMNDMYIPFLYMPSQHLRTLTTNLMAVFADPRLGSWPNLSAAIIIVMLPVVIIYLIFQEKIMNGIMVGAVKG